MSLSIEEENQDVLPILLNENSSPNTDSNVNEENFKYGLGNIIQFLLSFYANKLKNEVKSEHLKQKIENELNINEFEIEVINEITKPFMDSLMAKMGIEHKGFYAIISLITIILPRISLVMEIRKEIDKEKQNNIQEGV